MHLFLSLGFLVGSIFAQDYTQKVLLISMDGFRYDYLDKVPTPNFDMAIQNGVRAGYMNATFLTKTFPGHYSMSTGLYQESHGIVENRMFDPVFNSSFSMSNLESRWWNGGEPIWITARRNGLRSGTYFWPGSAVEIRGLRPHFWLPYDGRITYKTRIDTVMNWFVNESIDIGTIYFNEPDNTGHGYGPESEQVEQEIMIMDFWFGYIMDSLKKHNLHNKVNVMVVSDHGMQNVKAPERLIAIYEHINRSDIARIPAYGPVMHILPVAGKLDFVYNKLKNAHPRMTVWKKEEIPEHYRFKNNRRVMPIIAHADEGWQIAPTDRSYRTLRGQHGWDNDFMSMKPFFVAHGPNFRPGQRPSSINAVDLYPMMCELLKITPSPNNGSLARVQHLLQETTTPSTTTTTTPTPTTGTGNRLQINAAILFSVLYAFMK